jgi:hypothetical protein
MAGAIYRRAARIVCWQPSKCDSFPWVLVNKIPLRPSVAYGLLTFLKSVTIIGALGLLMVAGLLYLKVDAWVGWGRELDGKRRWWPRLDPLPAVVATVGLAFILVAVFIAPGGGAETVRGWGWEPESAVLGGADGWVGSAAGERGVVVGAGACAVEGAVEAGGDEDAVY